MNADPAVDYARLLPLHDCGECGSGHELREFPVNDGWVVAVVCGRCRDKTGLPQRYSVESDAFPTLELASEHKRFLLAPPQQPEPEDHDRNIYFKRSANLYAVQFQRNNKHIHVGYFKSVEDARVVRDAFLDQEAA